MTLNLSTSPEDKIKNDIARLEERLAKHRSGITMKYALESLPELIGEQDFKDLCLLLKWHEPHHALPSGADFSRWVHDAAFKRRHQAQGLLESRKSSVSELFPNQSGEPT